MYQAKILDVSKEPAACIFYCQDGRRRLLQNVDIYLQDLRYCATSRKVAGSIHDGGTGVFH
jgi:hypothetical protein